jgi:hypothetical protein
MESMKANRPKAVIEAEARKAKDEEDKAMYKAHPC